MKKCNLITEINLEDFLKLSLIGYKRNRHYFNEKGQEIPSDQIGEIFIDSKGEKHYIQYNGITSRVLWDKVSLNDIVLENIEFSNKEGFKNRCICVAIHTEPSEEEIQEGMKSFNYVKAYSQNALLTKYTRQEAYEQLLFKYSYLDKFLTWNGNQTYLIRCDVKHLYSEKRKFCTRDDYFDVPKSETKAIYLVRY